MTQCRGDGREANSFAPDAQLRYRRQLEEPLLEEGFCALEPLEFAPRPGLDLTRSALLFDHDGLTRRSRAGHRTPSGPEDVELLPGAREAARRLAAEGKLLLGVSQLPEIERGVLSPAEAATGFERTHELLGVTADAVWCPHQAGPPRCWCQPPLPGLGVLLIERHQLDPARCAVIGSRPAERGLARRLGMRFVSATSLEQLPGEDRA